MSEAEEEERHRETKALIKVENMDLETRLSAPTTTVGQLYMRPDRDLYVRIQPSDEECVDVDDGEGGKPQTIRLVKGPVTGAGDEECDARLQGRRSWRCRVGWHVQLKLQSALYQVAKLC